MILYLLVFRRGFRWRRGEVFVEGEIGFRVGSILIFFLGLGSGEFGWIVEDSRDLGVLCL